MSENNTCMDYTIRFAKEEDVPLIFRFIKDLARYEKMEHEVVCDESVLRETLFGEKAYAEVIFAEVNKEPLGFALFFHNYSTFLGRPGIYIEDLYVTEKYRKKGLGKALFRFIAKLALERKCGRVNWWVLTWNPARKFYEHIGAEPQDEWLVYKLSGDALHQLASGK